MGGIPTSLGSLTNLQSLDLHSNQLTGGIPSSLGNLTNLQYLSLYHNQLSDSIPSSLGNLTNLLTLVININQLSGSIPASLGNISNLNDLDLSYNQLTGAMPSSLANITNLQKLNLFDNQLSGTVPDLSNINIYCSINLQYNNFTFNGMEALTKKGNLQRVNVTYGPQNTIPLHFNGRQFYVSAGGTLSNNTYNWYKGDSLVKTISGDSTYTPAFAGNYSVAVNNRIAIYLTLYSDTPIIRADSLIMPAKPNTEYANYEITDTAGWTHYYFDNNTPNNFDDDTLLLSLKKNGQDIGTIGDGTFAMKLVATKGAGSNTGILLNNPLITNPSGYWVMNRYWQVTPTQEPTGDIGVRFYYNNQDLKDVNGSYPTHNLTNNNLIFYKAVDGNPDPTTNLAGATKIISIVSGTYASDTTWTYHVLSDTTQYGEYSVASFSGGGGGGTGNGHTLPITFLNFTGQQTHDGNSLQWQTASEINSAYFTVQRSANGQHFSNIGKVAAAGNSSSIESYNYTDALAGLNPLPSTLFYRLEETDKDGAVTYSKIISINTGGIPSLSLLFYPNPVHDILGVQLKGITGQVEIRVVDASGKTLQVQKADVVSGQSININTEPLAGGVYFVQVWYNRQSFEKKFVKE